MAPIRDFKRTIVTRVRRDLAFAIALLDEAVTLFFDGELYTPRIILSDLVYRSVQQV